MSREIKFRAWDYANKRMRLFDSAKEGILFSGSDVYFSTGWSSLDDPTFDEDNQTKFELMEYTDLKDKNGKDIYEGDIVQYGNSNKEKLFEVRFFKEWGVWGLNDNGRPFGRSGSSTKYEPYFMTTFHRNKIQVIGNIYENKDLINE
jgi:uncharacterized phage protein (TIGR01671 family)